MSSYIDRLTASPVLVRGCHHTTRVKHVLNVTGFPDHWTTIENCSPYRRCNSAYCNSCRTRHTLEHARRLHALWRHYYSNDELVARDNVRFVTCLNELCLPTISDVKGALTKGKRTFQGLKRSFPRLRIHGRFELEIVDTDMAFSSSANPQKRLLLHDLNECRSSFSNRDMVLVHSHTLFFLYNNNSEAVRDKLTRYCDARYAVNMKKLYDDKSVDDNITKICNYMLKDRLFYNYNMGTHDYQQGMYLRDESLSFLIRSYMSQDIGIDKSLYWSKK